MLKTLHLIALLCGAVYFGATAYITLVEHPGRLVCSARMAWGQWVSKRKVDGLSARRFRSRPGSRKRSAAYRLEIGQHPLAVGSVFY